MYSYRYVVLHISAIGLIQSNLNALTSGNAENHQEKVGTESVWWEHGSFLEHDVEHHRLVDLSTGRARATGCKNMHVSSPRFLTIPVYQD